MYTPTQPKVLHPVSLWMQVTEDMKEFALSCSLFVSHRGSNQCTNSLMSPHLLWDTPIESTETFLYFSTITDMSKLLNLLTRPLTMWPQPTIPCF